MNIMFFGDSITQGYWGIQHGWVDRVRLHYDELLFAKNEYHGIYNLGVDGDTAEDILKRIKAELQARIRPHHTVMPIIALQIGVNDNLTKNITLDTALVDYRNRLQEIIDTVNGSYTDIILIGYPSCNEELTTPVTWGEYYYTNEKIRAYEIVMLEVASSNKIKFIPVFDKFKEKVDKGESLLADGLHPNDEGHEVIYQIVIPALQESLK